MAEHPGTPGTPHTPEPSDDDLSPVALDGLGLGSLADDVRPDRSQWAAIEAAAARRRTDRRPWLISAAAAVVLVVAVTGLLVARSGREQPDVVAGVGPASAPWALPPEDAEVVGIIDASDQWVVQVDVDGQRYTLTQRIDVAGVTGTTTLADGIEARLPGVLGTRVTIPGVGPAYLLCSGLEERPAADGTTEWLPTGPSAVSWSLPGWAYFLSGQPTSMEPGNCGAEDPDPSPLLDLAASLRFVDAAGKQAFLDEHRDVAEEMQGLTGPATTVTTMPEDPPADRASAEEQIAAAVAGFSDRAADGTFPNLEDGVAKAAEYRAMFDLAARQSGADQDNGTTQDTSVLSRLAFVTPERASITMEMTATLPTGRYTFGQEGEAILQDGSWVITYRTVISTLGRACTPPGGYDGCP